MTGRVLKIYGRTRQICGPEMSLSGVCLKSAASAKKAHIRHRRHRPAHTHSLLNPEPISLPWADYRGGIEKQSSTCYFLCNSLFQFMFYVVGTRGCWCFPQRSSVPLKRTLSQRPRRLHPSQAAAAVQPLPLQRSPFISAREKPTIFLK